MKVIHVFTLISTARSFFDGQFKYLAEEGGYEMYLVTSDEEDVEFCNRNHLKYFQIPLSRAIDIKADLKSIRDLKKLIKKEKFDAVFGHTPKGALIAMIASRLAGVKNRVYYRHGYIYTTAKGFKRFILKSVERLTALCATKIVNVSPSIGKLAVQDHINSDKKQIVIGKGTCGGIDTKNLFNPDLIDEKELNKLRVSLDISENDFVVGFCGRICKEKGIRELIDGFKLFQSNNPQIKSKLLLVGAYDQREFLPTDYKAQITSNPDIVYPGRISKESLSFYYALMDVFVLPSYREGFGMCVIEAGAMGVPVMVSKSHGCIDSIKEKVSGIYIDLTPEGVEKGLKKMLDDSVSISLKKMCRDYVVKNFDHSILWPQILQLYKGMELNCSK